jgi:hypothetical protein
VVLATIESGHSLLVPDGEKLESWALHPNCLGTRPGKPAAEDAPSSGCQLAMPSPEATARHWASTWRKSLSDFAKTTTTAVSSVAKAVPVGIAKAGGDVVIRAAAQIEGKRSPGNELPELISEKPGEAP